MRTDVLDKAVRAQGGAVVKPHQVKAMVLAARRAYIEQAKLGLVDDGVGFDAWRRATLHDIVGAAAPSSFRAVTQRDYAGVMRYFGELAGDRPGDGARRAAAPDERTADEWRRALWALSLEEERLQEAFGGREGARKYADALFAKIHRTDRLGATARQVWAVIFTLRNRAAGKRAETAPGALGAPGVPSSPPGRSKRFPGFSRGFQAIPG
ncbi:MAG: hypothetical protein ACI4RD_02970 [Kiritimatiellia bacterium]